MGGIYLRQGDELVAMREAPYSTEAVLQELIARHPKTLSADGPAGEAWLLIKREVAVYDEDFDPSRGWLDHLFIDAEGVPTLVEVKRSTDTRIRREVVGQILDYAAGATNWKVEQLQDWLRARCATEALDLDQVLSEHAGDVDAFWEHVRTNLAARRLRLVIVSDVIPAALRAVIELLNEQMSQCEVIGIEIKQYLDADGEQTIVVPRVLGQTQAAQHAKGKRQSRHWDRASFTEDLRAKQPPTIAAMIDRVLRWADGRSDLVWRFGKGSTDASLQIGIHDQERRIFPFVIYSNGWLEIPFVYMASYRPFADEDLRRRYNERLNAVPGLSIEPDAINRRPNKPLAVLRDEKSVDQFLSAVDWALAQH